MNAEVLSYVYDFASILAEDKEVTDSIRRIILFGSSIRDELDRMSDIDIFIDTTSPIDDKVKKRLNLFDEIARKKWHSRKISYPIKCIVGDLDDSRWDNIREELIAQSIVLYGPLLELPEGLNQKVLVEYVLQKIPQKAKVKFLRDFFGYSNKKEKKVYYHKGMVEKLGGRKVNAIIIPREHLKKFKEFLHKYRIKYALTTIFAKE